MLINVCMTHVMHVCVCVYDSCHATLLNWTILRTENEQLISLQLFHQVLPLCMLKLTMFQFVFAFVYIVGGCFTN